MPTPDYPNVNVPDIADLAYSVNACPTPSVPSPEVYNQNAVAQPSYEQVEHFLPGLVSPQEQMIMNNNTGAGMAQSQEDSMYITPGASPEPSSAMDTLIPSDGDRMDIVQDEHAASKAVQAVEVSAVSENDVEATSSSSSSSPLFSSGLDKITSTSACQGDSDMTRTSSTVAQDHTSHTSKKGLFTPPASPLEPPRQHAEEERRKMVGQAGIAKIDQELNWNTTTVARDCLTKPIKPHYPSSVFQMESKYAGTQQSDRQIYNVNVRILTIDTKQSTCTGYLLIKGLTPEHDTLQTYFTGEIIGGPKQKYSFRTKTADWGASEKTDLTHWARFPPWRSLTTLARQNLDFQYPVSGENWWDQEHIFMRWKEHFLVPDHKTRSIAGASFEGFYYICLNQVEAKISGIYFHSKSEK